MKLSPFTKTYGDRRVLNFPGLTLEKGKIYGVIGANGSGKSTFAKILAGVLAADRKGKLCDADSIGYMPQKNFAFRMSVKKNLLLCGEDETRAEKLLAAFGLTELADKRADRLSGGETARMALARLMMKRFELVILDEPCAAMDIESAKISEDMILEYVKETGCTLVLITHSLQQARRLADSILYFHKGELAEVGEKEALLSSPEKEETRTFLEYYGL